MMKSLLVVFFVTCFFCCAFVTSYSVVDLSFPVPRDQVEILLAFKNEFPSGNCDLTWKPNFFDLRRPKANISSWTKDATSFDGVSFDSETGVVTRLDLQRQCLTSLKANSSLFRFHHLRYLDLSENLFDSSPIPAGLDRLTNLEHLDLRKNGFIGEVPSSISNLSRLTFLNLSYNKFTGPIPNLQNLTLLTNIDLSYNHFSESIPSYLFTMTSIYYLNLRHNHLRDPLKNISSSVTSKLYKLDMANNLLTHRILEPISKLSALTYLDLSFQNTTYTFNFDFLHFKSLVYLDLSGNSVSVLGTPGSTTLRDLFLSRCNITEFPTFIKGLQKLWRLDVSKNGLKGKVPEWLWNLPSMYLLNLSHNSFSILEGSPKVLLNSSISELDLSSNAFRGSFPLTPPTINVMDASNNNFTGGIPLSLCKASRMFLLDLSDNNFSGSIPRCLTNSLYLRALKLRNNNLTGILPDLNSGLLLLDVGHNQISGKLPRFLVNCEGLMFLNVERNLISDTFPFWLKALPDLQVIVLRSNRFHGPISSLESPLPFPALRIIDISHNNFSGSLPPNYFVNWSAPLVNSPQVSRWPEYTGDDHSTYESPLWFYPSIYLRIKGRNTEFEKIQKIYTSIDFSGNRFEGQIPESIGHLKSLMALDLSDNSFTGHIPSSLAKLKQLESLDLSQNQLSGRIPQELSVLTFLEYINMSHNRLTGQIPQSTQIGGQDKSSFEGNLKLCGLPLQESCFRENGAPSTQQTQEPELPKKEQMVNWKAAAIGYGPGVLIGLAIGQALASYKPVLFYKLFRL